VPVLRTGVRIEQRRAFLQTLQLIPPGSPSLKTKVQGPRASLDPGGVKGITIKAEAIDVTLRCSQLQLRIIT